MLACSSGALSQTGLNGSFESIDSNGVVVGWKVKKGNAKRNSAQFRFGFPFTATDQGFFLSLDNDTVTLPIKTAEISNTFPFTLAPPTFIFDAFYAPSFTFQKYGIQILFTKWRNNKRDTIMYKSDSISAVMGTNNDIIIKWSEKKLDLSLAYQDTAMPDSASITINNDIISPFANATFLLIDNIRFHSLKIGVDEKEIPNDNYVIYPNPASTNTITIDVHSHLKKNNKLTVSDITGKYWVSNEINFEEKVQIDVSQLLNGLYFVNIDNGESNKTMKLIIAR